MDEIDELTKKEEKETERIAVMLDGIDRLLQLVNKQDQLETINALLSKIKEEIEASPDLLEFSKEGLAKRVDYQINYSGK